MFSKILLPLDGSELSSQAVAHAANLAKKMDAPVVLLQVVDSEAQVMSQSSRYAIEPLRMGQVSAEAARRHVTAERRAAEENLGGAKTRLEEDGISVTAVIREGNPGEEIVEAATELGCDVVVMATHGRSGMRRAILGSVADHVARNTPNASVLLVKPEEAEA